jgi:hypothetical protein
MDCYEQASKVCRGPYQVLASESHRGGLIADLVPGLPGGPVMYFSMNFTSGPSDGRLPEFPFRGP